jgi:hypothetical protein
MLLKKEYFNSLNQAKKYKKYALKKHIVEEYRNSKSEKNNFNILKRILKKSNLDKYYFINLSINGYSYIGCQRINLSMTWKEYNKQFSKFVNKSELLKIWYWYQYYKKYFTSFL